MKKFLFIRDKTEEDEWYVVYKPKMLGLVDFEAIVLMQDSGNWQDCTGYNIFFQSEFYEIKEYNTQEELIVDNITDIL